MAFLAFDHLLNFRDLGGYRTVDGRTVRPGRLYRADDLGGIQGNDIDRFASLGIRTVVDLRRPDEVEERGRVPEFDGLSYRSVNLVHAEWPSVVFADYPARSAYLVDRYLGMTETGIDAIGEALRLIADPTRAPLVFHCRAGRDRTGIIAALTLCLLGVSDDDVADDYALTDVAEEVKWAAWIRHHPEDADNRLQHFWISPRDAMLDLLARIRANHVSIVDYVARAGVTSEHLAGLRRHLLTDGP